jgi:exosome complex exonuclease DIS3/RRP44
MKMVAEYMIMANCSVAKKIWEKYPESALLRRHPFPNANAFQDMVKAANFYGIKMDYSTNKNLARFSDLTNLVNSL